MMGLSLRIGAASVVLLVCNAAYTAQHELQSLDLNELGALPTFGSGLSSHSRGFEENKGQVLTSNGASAPFVRYRLQQGNAQIFLLDAGIAHQFERVHYPDGYHELERQRMRDPEREQLLHSLRKEIRTETFRMDMVLEGANTDALAISEGRSEDYVNYYTHNVLDVHSYDRLTYHNVYPGIDWVLYTTENGLKYDFVVHPGADPAQIKLRFIGHEELRVDGEGDLIHGNRMGRFVEASPVSYQVNGIVESQFILEDDLLTFDLGAFDRNQVLVIDPSRVWATYYGSSADDRGLSCAVDPSGNVYMSGGTTSTSGIASLGHQMVHGGGAFDAMLVKFSSAGSRLWATYYGGSQGGDYGMSCATDGVGNVFMAGYTDAPNNIASGGHQNTYGGGSYDAFLVKFNSAGVRQWGTYYGGAGWDSGEDCAVDQNGNCYLSGMAGSPTGIGSGGHQNTYGGSQDGLLVKFDPSGVRLWGTYYGGSEWDDGYSCATDATGNVYLSGGAVSTTGIAMGGYQNTISGASDAYVVKFDPSGTRQWGTYYGGTQGDGTYACSVDASGNVLVTGITASTSGIASSGYQNANGGFYDAFLVKFAGTGSLLWGTYYGGSSEDSGRAIATDASGNIFLAGETESDSVIAYAGYQDTLGGDIDYFLVKFNSAGTRLWGSYYGGAEREGGFNDCPGLAVHGVNVYLSGMTFSSAGIAGGGFQDNLGGFRDGFLVKFDGSDDVGLSESIEEAFEVSPNPTSDVITISSSGKGQRYSIMDMHGRTLVEGNLTSRTEQLDLSEQPEGMYIVLVRSFSTSAAVRVVKQ